MFWVAVVHQKQRCPLNAWEPAPNQQAIAPDDPDNASIDADSIAPLPCHAEDIDYVSVQYLPLLMAGLWIAFALRVRGELYSHFGWSRDNETVEKLRGWTRRRREKLRNLDLELPGTDRALEVALKVKEEVWLWGWQARIDAGLRKLRQRLVAPFRGIDLENKLARLRWRLLRPFKKLWRR